MARLPVVGGDSGNWGTILNDFLEVSLNADGTITPAALTAAGAVTSVNTVAPNSSGNVTLTASNVGAYAKPSSGIPATDLSSAVQADLTAAATAVQLGGDIGGANTVPIVTKLQGTTVNAASPSANQVLSYVGGQWVPSTVTSTTVNDATSSSPGIVQLDGDLGGSASSPSVVKVNGVAVSGTPSSGQVITASSSLAASWSTPPTAPVSSVNGQTGVVNLTAAEVGAPTTLAGDSDVSIASPANNQVLTYNSGSSKWTNVTPVAGSLAGDSDVTISSPSNGQGLLYNSSASKWENQTIPTASNATSSTPGLIQLDGNLGGSATSPQVVGTNLAAPLPISQGGTGSATQNFLTLGGDLGNSVTSPTVESIQGVGISGTPSSGQALIASSSSAATWSALPSAPVSSVFGRTGVVTAQSGDYTAGQVGALPATDDLSAIASANPTAGNVSLNSHKLTNLANGSAASDAAAFGQIPTSAASIGGLLAANNLSDVGSANTARGNLGAAQGLVPTAVKTSAYSASPGDFVPVDASGGSVTITLPTTPMDKTRVGVKMIAQGGTNTVTVATGGSDVFNKAGGSGTYTLKLLNQGALLQYASTSGIWYVQADDLALAQLDSRYLASNGVTVSGTPSSGQALIASSSSAATWGFLPGLQPSGDTTGATDTTTINSLLSSTGYVQLCEGTFYIDAPLVVPANAVLRGFKGATTSVYDMAPPSSGTIIRAVTGWSGTGSSIGVIQMTGSSVRLRDFFLDASNITQTNVHGVTDVGSQSPVYMENVGIYDVTGNGINQNGTAWHLFDVVVCIAYNNGMQGSFTDSVLVNVHCQGCGQGQTGSGFYIQGGPCKLVACRGDCSAWGYSITATAGSTYQDPIQLIGCGSQRNSFAGYRIRNAYSTNGNPPIVLSGCTSDGDGINGTVSTASQGSVTGGTGGGGYGAIMMYGAGTLLVSGFANTASTRDTGTTPCPQYGLVTTNDWGGGTHVPDFVSVSGSFLVGDTAPVLESAAPYLLRIGQDTATYSGGIFLGAANGDNPAPASGQFLCSPSQYAPASLTTLTVTSTTFAAFSSANVNTGSFLAPTSGTVMVTVSCVWETATSGDKIAMALAEHGTLSPIVGYTPVWNENGATPLPGSFQFLVSGLTAGTVYNLDLLGASQSGTSIELLAQGQTSTTPTFSSGAPVIMSVQAV
jgi:hypothetical protein